MCEHIGSKEMKSYKLDCLDGIDAILQDRQPQQMHQQDSSLNNNTDQQRQKALPQQELETSQRRKRELPDDSEDINSYSTLPSSVSNPPKLQPIGHSLSRETHSATKPRSMSRKDENFITCMLVTANVGTIFEESSLLELWFEQLKSYLVKIKPQLVAIHCQEVGGKNYETSMKNVSSFTDKILGDEKIIGDYKRVRIFLDENYECLEKFTALGSLYLVHDSVDNVKLYNFKTCQYEPIKEGRHIYAVSDKKDLVTAETESNNSSSNNNEQTQEHHQKDRSLLSDKFAEHVEKIKFPLELFPECRWSRKGFMRTRWLFNDCQPLDLVNIHLFHDASNLVAMKTTPSPYAQNRQKALEFALEKLTEPLKVSTDNNNYNVNIRGHVSHLRNVSESDTQPLVDAQISQVSSQPDDSPRICADQQVPLFIFGDFNFRLDTNKVIQKITEGISPVVKRSANSNEVVEFVYHRKPSDCSASTKQQCETKTPDSKVIKKSIDLTQDLDHGGVLMTVGKKLFDYQDLDETFRATKNTEWLLKLDNELDRFRHRLYEFKISFSPSYPFKEDETGGYSYMKTRCPAWCDRILFNAAGCRMIGDRHNRIAQATEANASSPISENQIERLQNQDDVIYRLMGNSVPMGDHKPVLLYCRLSITSRQYQQRCLQENPSSLTCNRVNQVSTEETGGVIEEACNENAKDGVSNLLESTAM